MIYDAEHFFDGYRDDSGYALECLRAAVDAGAENVTLCDTNGSSLPHQVAEATARGRRRASASEVEVGIHTHNDAECGVANSLAAVDEGARLVQGTINGYGERCGNANLVSILPALQLKMGFECVERRAARPADRDRALHRRALQHDAGPRPALRRPQRLRPQGRHARRRGQRRRAHLRAHRPGAGRQPARHAASPSSPGKATVLTRRPSRPDSSSTTRRRARAVERLKEREHRGYHYEAADASFELLLRREAGDYEPLFRLESFRVITEKREDGRGPDRGDDQGLGRAASATCAPPRATARSTPSTARCATRSPTATRTCADIELTNYKVRILDEHHGTGAVTRVLLDSSDGEREWGTIGVSENIIEASWEALVDSLEYAFQPRARRAEPARRLSRADPARAARTSARARRSWCSRCCAPGRLSLGPMLERFERELRRLARASRTRSPSPAAPRRCTSGCGRSAGARATRSSPRPFSFVASANCLLYEGARPVFCDVDPDDPQPRPRARPRPRSASGPPGLLPVHIFGYPAGDAGARGSSPRGAASGILEDACEALGAVDSEGRRSARAATSPPSPSTPTSR